MTTERRFIPRATGLLAIEERDGKAPLIRGYAAVFYDGTPETEFRLWPGMVERVSRGAFDRAIKEDDVRGLFNHDPNLILGRTAAAPPTLRLSVDRKGLRYEIDPPDTQTARDLLVAIKRGDVTGSSFGFRVKAEKFIRPEADDAKAPVVRQIEDVELFDVSPVTFPAYEATQVEARGDLAARAGIAPPEPVVTPARRPTDVAARLERLEADEKRPRFA